MPILRIELGHGDRFRLCAIGALLVLAVAGMALLSGRFAYQRDPAGMPIVAIVGLQVLAGAVYLAAAVFLRRRPDIRWPWSAILGIGVALRAIASFSTPVLEDDFYRYLWDGAVAAHGENPYAFAPSRILTALEGEDAGNVPGSVIDLARQSGQVLRRINHPDVRTIYPPVAQAAFALAYEIAPWRLWAWRLVLLIFDGATLALILALLAQSGLPFSWAALYWWNPVLIKEIYNSAHMDVIALPFVLGSILLASRGKSLGASGVLAVAAGAKIWPALLLPLLVRPLIGKPKRLAVSFLMFFLVAGILFVPVFRSGLDPSSGFWAYSNGWEMNDALFMLVLWPIQALSVVVPGIDAAHLARLSVFLLLMIWIAMQIRRPASDAMEIAGAALCIVAAAFLLSPTQFPWYYLWMLPLLALNPRFPLLLLAALLPLYYLRFAFNPRHQVNVFDYGIVWLEFAPVWLLLIRDWHRGQRRHANQIAEGIV